MQAVVNGISYWDFVREWARATDEEIALYEDMFEDLPWPLNRILADVARLRKMWAQPTIRELPKKKRPTRSRRTGRQAGKCRKKSYAR